MKFLLTFHSGIVFCIACNLLGVSLLHAEVYNTCRPHVALLLGVSASPVHCQGVWLMRKWIPSHNFDREWKFYSHSAATALIWGWQIDTSLLFSLLALAKWPILVLQWFHQVSTHHGKWGSLAAAGVTHYIQTSDMLDYKHTTHSQYGYRLPTLVHSAHKIYETDDINDIKSLWNHHK